MMRTAVLSFVLLAATSALLYSDTINIPADYPTIQEGIDAAVTGDTVLVAPGTYVENIDFKGKAITLKSSDGAETTVIDAKKAGSVVTFRMGEDSDSILAGFTIFNGEYTARGGGVFCDNASWPIIMNNIIIGSKSGSGGGISCETNSCPTITNNLITGNIAERGGGINCTNSNPIIKNNVITGNRVFQFGGGIRCYNSSPTISNNTITGNKAYYYGGGIYCHYSSSVITGNRIDANKVYYWGGGICCKEASPVVSNNSIIGNTSNRYGGGIFCIFSDIKVINTILWDNQAVEGTEIYLKAGYLFTTKADISYSNVKPGEASVIVESGSILNWGDGMLESDPLFVDPINSDYHLTYNSPCRDSGDNRAVTELFDVEGDPRIAWDATVDMGADEFYTHLYVEGYKTPGGRIQDKLIGLPGTSPVYLIIGSEVRETPVTTPYGAFHLQPPIGLFSMAPIPANGVLGIPSKPTTIPLSIPPPYDIPMQGLVGLNSDSFTNLCVLEVR